MRSRPSENRTLPCGTDCVSVADSINRAVPQSPSVFSGTGTGQVLIRLNELTMLSWWIRLHRTPFSWVPVKGVLLLEMQRSHSILDGHMQNGVNLLCKIEVQYPENILKLFNIHFGNIITMMTILALTQTSEVMMLYYMNLTETHTASICKSMCSSK